MTANNVGGNGRANCDAQARRALNEQIKQRRAKRKRALEDFEIAIRAADQCARPKND